jgi:hypothetical protein
MKIHRIETESGVLYFAKVGEDRFSLEIHQFSRRNGELHSVRVLSCLMSPAAAAEFLRAVHDEVGGQP